ncbi:MAG: flippase-like domain-containing protein [Candidatus Zixiibacteriota bacterium]|nr:MAG: flippase-like domain-containing protein [candidate division Zixibacteria bacterium]
MPEDNITEKKAGGYLKRLIKLILFIAVVYFAGKQFVNNWSDVSGYDWDLNYIFLMLSFIFQLSTLILFSKSWCTVLDALGFEISLKQGFKISYLANLGRYIPGKFWQIFGMIYLLKQINIGKKTAFTSWALSWIYGIPPGLLLCGIAAFFYGDLLSELLGGIFNSDLYIALFVFCVIALSVLFLFIPDYSIKFLNLILKLLKRDKIVFKFKKSMAIKVYSIYFISWINYGLAFYFLIRGLDSSSDVPFMVGLGSFVLAYLVGLLALFSPGGLGVRELILNSLLMPYFGPVAAGIVVAARVWSLVAEISAAGTALLLYVKDKRV